MKKEAKKQQESPRQKYLLIGEVRVAKGITGRISMQIEGDEDEAALDAAQRYTVRGRKVRNKKLYKMIAAWK